jgi:hypothetical protein
MTDLTPYLNRPDILNDTAKQVIKDFGMQGMEINFSGNTGNTYVELFSQILPIIEKLIIDNTEKFYALLYRIDISEVQVKKAVEKATDKSFSEIVTDLILKRELLKVVIRKNYAAGKEL